MKSLQKEINKESNNMKKKNKGKFKAQTRSILSWEARQADYYRAQGFLIAVVLIGLILWML